MALSWFTAEVDGQAKYLRVWLEERGVSYVMAIRRCDAFTTSVGEQRADALIAELPARSWQRLSVGAGAHGPPEYHWARIAIPGAAKPGRRHWSRGQDVIGYTPPEIRRLLTALIRACAPGDGGPRRA